ncbi:zinc finger protein 862-like [Asterias rubens]|uniref:zinc finger protein 862-like n=1 Tax=Asterias rubens TaxID=7604 RepID=UPI001455487D|nr:zinc finger protein 862-like [Asterias rubens]
MVTKIWCKVCRTFINKIKEDTRIRGQAQKDIEAYVIGSAFVTKYTATRHLSSKAHSIGLEYQRLLGEEGEASSSGVVATPGPIKRTQPNIAQAIHSVSDEAYRKLLRSAYIMAVDGLPLSTFKTLVRVQKANGVKLIQGTESSNRAKEFVHVIADVIRSKLTSILCSAPAFSVLSDGSQTRKTGNEKELVMVRVVKDGHPKFFVAALENVDSYGDATAGNLHKSIKHALTEKVKLPADKYTKALVSATADGASVNTGVYNGLLVRLQRDGRPWLVMIHCISHRLELAVKDALMNEAALVEVKELMVTIYYLMKRSGKFKRHFEATGKALECQVYKFPKVHGTRFVGHQRNGLRILLNNWIPLALAIENSIMHSTHSNLNAKLRGILKKLRRPDFLATSCLFFEILDIISALSLKFERGDIHAFEVLPAVEVTKISLQGLLEDESSASLIQKAGYTYDPNSSQISRDLPKEGHMRRSAENRQYSTVSLEKMAQRNLRHGVNDVSESLCQKCIPLLMKRLDDRFSSFNNESVFTSMSWLNPANWREDDVTAEVEAMEAVAAHFSTSLAAVGFQSNKIKREWQMLKVLHKTFYRGTKTKDMWGQIIKYRRNDMPNMCLLVEVAMAIGVSNSTVECGFSILTSMLSDRRLSLNHNTMEDLLLIKANHLVWEEHERDDILEDALKLFMLKRRKLVPDDGVEVGPKKIKLSEDNLQISDIDSCSSSDTDSDSGGSAEPDDEDVNGKSGSESDERETSDGAEATTSNPDNTSDDSSF